MLSVAQARSALSSRLTYEQNLLQILANHAEPPTWVSLDAQAGGRSSTIWVMADAVRVPVSLVDGTVLRWRPAVSAAVAQAYADRIGAMLPTQRIVDATLAAASTVIAPQNDTITWAFSGSIEHSRRCDQAIARKLATSGAPAPGLVENVGKYWILTNQLAWKSPGTACNYGWFAKWGPSVCEPSRVQCYQQPGYQHDAHHWDYSQTLRLAHGMAEVDGTPLPLADLLRSATLASLWSYEGPLLATRQVVLG